jgi:hypothetical protein
LAVNFSAVAGTSVGHTLYSRRDNWLETMHVKASCQLEFAQEIPVDEDCLFAYFATR